MKLRIFTLSTLFLFFSIKTTAQITHAPASNIVDITFLISDTNDDVSFELTHLNDYSFNSELDLVFRINMDYQSAQDIVGFFGVQYKISKVSLNGLLIELIRGTTVPVVIPPVRKNRTRVHSESEEYPFKIFDEIDLEQATYQVEMNLVKYHSRADYLANNDNFTALPTIGFELVAITDIAVPLLARNSASLLVYPNPVIDEVIFDYTSVATEQDFSQNLPVEVTIFNGKGFKISSHTLTGVSKNKHALYQLNISHLPKGMYFYQLKRGGKTEIKTIIKK